MNRSQAAVTQALSASENAALGLNGLRMAHNRLSPVPQQQLVEPMSRMRSDALEYVGDRTTDRHRYLLPVTMRLYMSAALRRPRPVGSAE